MAGFAVLYGPSLNSQEREINFQSINKLTAQFKGLEQPGKETHGKFCSAKKFDAPSSLHSSIVLDEQSGSWLMAAGTVVALNGNNDPQALLGDLLVEYLDHGAAALENIDGHFALAIYNGIEDSLSIISDPMGLFAIFYARIGQQVIISTSALAVACQVGSKPDELSIECLLRTGRPCGERTLWEDVKRVRPATVIKITPDKFQEFEYWTFKIDENIARLSMNDALKLADEKICRVFDRLLTREGKVWADLTGGFDTRLTTMFMTKVGIPFIAYCVGPDGHPDVVVSRQVCQEMGWEYRHMPLPASWMDEQCSYYDAALGKGDGMLSVFQLAGILRGGQERSLTSFVTISGGGADEWRYHIFGANILIPSTVSKINYDGILNAKIMEDIPIAAMRHDRTGDVRAFIKDHLSRSISGYAGSKIISQIDIAFLRYRHPIHGGAYLSAQAGIVRPLVPFCFKELENFGLSLNHQWRIKNEYRFARNLLERGNPRLANIPTETGSPTIPIRLTNLNRFLPLWIYLADHFVSKVSKQLTGKRLYLRPPHHYPTYPLPAWKTAWINWAISEKLFEPDQMRSGVLYQPDELRNLAAGVLSGVKRQNEFLDRVITVEMAMRATGSFVE